MASVRPHVSPGSGSSPVTMRGGPGTNDPSQIVYSNVSLTTVLAVAEGGIYPYQIVGPDWLGRIVYDIVARLPVGTTNGQFHVMLLNLLADRFHLVSHHEPREVPGYDLLTAKSGLELKETTLPLAGEEAVSQSPVPAASVKTDSRGFPILDKAGTAMTMKILLNAKVPSIFLTARAQPVSGVAHLIGEAPGQPVADKTGLNARYDYTLEFTPDMRGAIFADASTDPAFDSGTAGIVTAVREQLGLRIEAGKVTLDMVIVDEVSKIPTEN